MNTRPQEAFPYRDLARQKARISRQIGVDELTRLRPLIEVGNATELTATMAFNINRNGFVTVAGDITGSFRLICNGCAESLDHMLDLNFACIVVDSEEFAARAVDESGEQGDVLVVEGAEMTVADLIEDEILLCLPERLCISQPCEMALETDFPAALDAVAAAQEKAEADNPFSVLAGLDVKTKKPLD